MKSPWKVSKFDSNNVSLYLHQFNLLAKDCCLTEMDKLHRFPAYCIGELISEVESLANAAGNDWDAFEESLKKHYFDRDSQQLECHPSSQPSSPPSPVLSNALSTSSPLPPPTITNNYDPWVDSVFPIILAEINSIIVASGQQPYPMPTAYQPDSSQESSEYSDEEDSWVTSHCGLYCATQSRSPSPQQVLTNKVEYHPEWNWKSTYAVMDNSEVVFDYDFVLFYVSTDNNSCTSHFLPSASHLASC